MQRSHFTFIIYKIKFHGILYCTAASFTCLNASATLMYLIRFRSFHASPKCNSYARIFGPTALLYFVRGSDDLHVIKTKNEQSKNLLFVAALWSKPRESTPCIFFHDRSTISCPSCLIFLIFLLSGSKRFLNAEDIELKQFVDNI